MHFHMYTRKRWFNFATHKWDGLVIFRKKKEFLVVRLGWVSIGFGKYFKTNKECYELDKIMKEWI